MVKPSPAKSRSMTKAQFMQEVAAAADLPKTQVAAVLAAVHALIAKELKRGSAVTIPDLVKVSVKRKPASAARPGRNPFTGEDIMIKAKPARNAVKVAAVKALKDLA
jgi:nucleoid DNA-binding protein